MNTTSTNTVDLLEVIWTSIVLVGFIAHIIGIGSAMQDLQAIKTAKLNGPRLMVAWTHLRNEVGRLVVSIIYMVIGIVALFTEPGNKVFSAIFVFGLLASVTEMTILSIIDIRDKRRLIQLMNKYIKDDTSNKELVNRLDKMEANLKLGKEDLVTEVNQVEAHVTEKLDTNTEQLKQAIEQSQLDKENK